MEERQVWERLGQIFTQVFGEEVALLPTTTAADVYGWDSVRHVELMVSVERAFAIRFTSAEISRLASVGELVDLLLARSAGR